MHRCACVSSKLDQDDFGSLNNNWLLHALLLNDRLSLCDGLIEALAGPGKPSLHIGMRDLKALDGNLALPE